MPHAYALSCGSVKVVMMNLSEKPAYLMHADGSSTMFASGEGKDALTTVSPFYYQCKLDVMVNGKLQSGLVAENTSPSTVIHLRINRDGSISSSGIDMNLNQNIAQYGMKYALGMGDQ
jgi:hypothetical protein